MTKLFGCSSEIAARTLSRLVKEDLIAEGVTRKDLAGEWFALSGLVR